MEFFAECVPSAVSDHIFKDDRSGGENSFDTMVDDGTRTDINREQKSSSSDVTNYSLVAGNMRTNSVMAVQLNLDDSLGGK